MSRYLSPGVYIQEKAEGVRPLAGVSTSNLGLIGWFERGPSEPTLVTSAEEFSRIFGGIKRFRYDNKSFEYYKAPTALMGYFQNGGARAYVVRIIGSGAQIANKELDPEEWVVKAANAGDWGNRVKVEITKNVAYSDENPVWDVTVYYKEYPNDDYNIVEVFSEVVFNNKELEYYAPYVVNPTSSFIQLEWTGSGEPADLTENTTVELAGGEDGTKPNNLAVADFNAFDKLSEMLILIAPDYCGDVSGASNQSATDKALITYCDGGGSAKRTNCFAIITTPRGITPQNAVNYVNNTLNVNSSRAAIYYPWIKIVDPITKKAVDFPPVGHIAGVFARTDTVKNVAKAPAGISDGALLGIVALERNLGKTERDSVYPYRINPLSAERYTGTCIWGARTLSLDPRWRYINVRRAFQYFETACFEGTHWINFENNTAATRLQVRMQLETFLLMHFYDGFFAGTTPGDSFFVICDDSNNPPQVVEQGIMYVDIGLAISKPAEFIVLRFSQKTAGVK